MYNWRAPLDDNRAARRIQVDEHMRTNDPDIYAAGDAGEVKDLPVALPCCRWPDRANRQGRVGAKTSGRATVYIIAATQGTAIVKVFDMTGGGTGANEKIASSAPAYLTAKSICTPASCRVLPRHADVHESVVTPEEGKPWERGQVVGFDGVDKRLDVLATAIRAGLTVRDLESLERLPPYGSGRIRSTWPVSSAPICCWAT